MIDLNKRAIELMGFHEFYFEPANSWSDAGMLVDKMSEKFSIVIFNDSVGWYVDVYIGTTLLHEITADTAPEAITRAFIKAMEAK